MLNIFALLTAFLFSGPDAVELFMKDAPLKIDVNYRASNSDREEIILRKRDLAGKDSSLRIFKLRTFKDGNDYCFYHLFDEAKKVRLFPESIKKETWDSLRNEILNIKKEIQNYLERHERAHVWVTEQEETSPEAGGPECNGVHKNILFKYADDVGNCYQMSKGFRVIEGTNNDSFTQSYEQITADLEHPKFKSFCSQIYQNNLTPLELVQKNNEIAECREKEKKAIDHLSKLASAIAQTMTNTCVFEYNL